MYYNVYLPNITERGSVLSPKYVLKRLGLQNAAVSATLRYTELLISQARYRSTAPTLAEIAKYRPKIKRPLSDL